MSNTALLIQKVLHLVKHWGKKKKITDYVCNEEEPSSLCRDPEVVLHGLVGAQSGWTPRRAGLQNAHGSCTHLPAHKIFPSSEPWGLKVRDTKANANAASLLDKADTGTFPGEQPSCFHTTFSSLSEREEGRTPWIQCC